jgi:hypothetical protein
MLVGRGSLSADFNVWNPLYALAPLVLLIVSIPLAIFAIVTTSIAVSLLACRAAVVYVQLAVALVVAWIDPTPSKVSFKSRRSSTLQSPERSSLNRHRNHRSSHASSTSSQDTIGPSVVTLRLPQTNGPSMVSHGTGEIPRDFEGLGGWRTPGNDDEEALWMGINSRLQLSADAPTRRYPRNLTGATSPAQRWSSNPEVSRMSPAQSRARTPVRLVADDEGGYFPPQTSTSMRSMSSATAPSKSHKRRRSGGSVSSIASAVTMTEKEA